ncbi:MAG: Fe-S cluster assembly protein SufD [Pirellulales bacterium]|nr:Fe-S cluster assembly protein SufD [Pirellulales bacterium]
MTQTAAPIGYTQESFDAFVAERDEPGWLVDLRREAFAYFLDRPLPSRREEEWMRTDIRLFKLEKHGLPQQPDPGWALPDALLAQGVDLGGQTAALDSHSLVAKLDDDIASQGVLFGSLDKLVVEHSDLLRPHFERRVVNPLHDKFSSLSAAFWSGGTLLYVPRGVVVDRPLHALAALSHTGVDLGRTLVVMEEDSEATLLSETASTACIDGGLHCGTVELLLAPSARLRYVNLQNWSDHVWHFAHQTAVVDRDAQLQWTVGALGSRLAKVNQQVTLTGPGADAQVNGAMFTEGRQHLSYHTRQAHEAPNCRSDLLYKGALQDHSHSVWRGMIRVEHGAQKTNAYQRNDNIMLSDEARADSIPGLEIEADDVVCTHGATAGRVDDEMIFYAQSRGFTHREAVRMIVAGFFQRVFDRITIDSVRESLGEAIGRRIRDYD